jgi:4-amino-4-deoxy-L-arabinose transferase-like glycosyltransferase
MTLKSRRRLLDCFYVGLLVLYALAGMMLAPYHGDEATTMYVARDWYTLVVQHDLSQILYRPDLKEQRLIDAQEFRLRMGASARYLIGFLTNLTGMNASDLTDPWFWGADYADNVAHGHVARPPVLFVARLSSALLLALSIGVVFTLGRRLGGRGVAWIGTGIYALTPALLLNGRRAMYEGSTALFIALMLLIGLEIVRGLHLKKGWRGLLGRWLLFGAVCGVAVAGKNSMALVALPIGAVLALFGWRDLARTAVCGVAAVALAAALFLLLNPAWWSQPLQMPAIVSKLNADLFKAQAEFFGGWTNTTERVLALVRFPFALPQYYEDTAPWGEWIGDQISAYQRSLLDGVAWGQFGLPVYGLMALGMAALLGRPRAEMLFFGAVLVGILVAVYVATPLPWQRYYLLLVAVWSVTMAIGLRFAWQLILNVLRKRLPGQIASFLTFRA